MLTDVQTWAQPFGAVGSVVLCSDALGHLGECVPWLCSARYLRTFRRWAQPFGAVVL